MKSDSLNLDAYTEDEVCQILGLAKKTMQKKRSMGKNHPPFIKLGAKIFFPRKLFHSWWNSQPIRECANGSGGRE